VGGEELGEGEEGDREGEEMSKRELEERREREKDL
jgi:hypothetical protein